MLWMVPRSSLAERDLAHSHAELQQQQRGDNPQDAQHPRRLALQGVETP
jgi:hypothetical protein